MGIVKFGKSLPLLNLLLIGFGLSFSNESQANERDFHLIYIEAGAIGHQIGKLSNSPSGNTSLLTSLYTDIALSLHIPLGASLSLSPWIGYTPIGNKSADEGEKSTLLPIALRVEKQLSTFFIHLGPGLMNYTVSGKGGTTTLNNGTGTATFGLPSDSSTSRLFLVDLGCGISIERVRIGVDALVTGLFSSQQRSLSLVANIGVGLF